MRETINWGEICQSIVDREGFGGRSFASNYDFDHPGHEKNDQMMVWLWMSLEDRNDHPAPAIPPRAWRNARMDMGFTVAEMAEISELSEDFIRTNETGDSYIPELRGRYYDFLIDLLPAESNSLIPSYYMPTLENESMEKREYIEDRYPNDLRRKRTEEWGISQGALGIIVGASQKKISDVERGLFSTAKADADQYIKTVESLLSGSRSISEVLSDAKERSKKEKSFKKRSDHTENTAELCSEFRRLRLSHGISQKKIAKVLGAKDQAYVSLLESGKSWTGGLEIKLALGKLKAFIKNNGIPSCTDMNRMRRVLKLEPVDVSRKILQDMGEDITASDVLDAELRTMPWRKREIIMKFYQSKNLQVAQGVLEEKSVIQKLKDRRDELKKELAQVEQSIHDLENMDIPNEPKWETSAQPTVTFSDVAADVKKAMGDLTQETKPIEQVEAIPGSVKPKRSRKKKEETSAPKEESADEEVVSIFSLL